MSKYVVTISTSLWQEDVLVEAPTKVGAIRKVEETGIELSSALRPHHVTQIKKGDIIECPTLLDVQLSLINSIL